MGKELSYHRIGLVHRQERRYALLWNTKMAAKMEPSVYCVYIFELQIDGRRAVITSHPA